LNIIDCTSCMETMGPKGGDIFNLNLIISGQNIGEVDYIGLKIMGFELEEINHLRKYLELNDIKTEEIEIIGEKLENVIRPFKKVQINDMVPNNIKIYSKNTCSACENALLLSFKFLENSLTDYFDIYLGTSSKNKSNNKSIAFGNCCTCNESDIIIKGCPPYPLELNKRIKDYKNRS